MTQDEVQQVNAAIAFIEKQLNIAVREGAQIASLAESLAIQLKQVRDELEQVKKVKE